MNDPRFHFFETSDHNLEDPDSKKGSRLSSQANESSSMCSDEEFVQFRPNSGDDSGVCSPPLWKSSPSPSRPLLSHHVHRSLTPSARLQAIARGQKELMEMVKNMPESSYELSLKDLVEHHRTEAPAAPESGVVKVKRQESKKSERNLVRNGSFELESKGMFLKMGFSFSLQSKRRSLDRSFSGGKIAGEGDWWKKKSGSSDSDSSRTSSNSGGGGGSSGGGDGRKNNSSRAGCWPFCQSKNSKSE